MVPTATMTYQEALRWAKGIDDCMRCGDFQNTILVIHQDGSRLQFANAVVGDPPSSDFVAVFTEHLGYHVFWRDEVTVSLVSR